MAAEQSTPMIRATTGGEVGEEVQKAVDDLMFVARRHAEARWKEIADLLARLARERDEALKEKARWELLATEAWRGFDKERNEKWPHALKNVELSKQLTAALEASAAQAHALDRDATPEQRKAFWAAYLALGVNPKQQDDSVANTIWRAMCRALKGAPDADAG